MQELLEFNELTQDQTMDVEGGVIPFVVGLGIGVGVAWVADGILIATTGKSGGEWVAEVINPSTPSHSHSSGSRSF